MRKFSNLFGAFTGMAPPSKSTNLAIARDRPIRFSPAPCTHSGVSHWRVAPAWIGQTANSKRWSYSGATTALFAGMGFTPAEKRCPQS